MESKDILSPELKTAYDAFYEGTDGQWRLLSARYKAKNILDVCAGRKFRRVLEVGAGDGSILQFLSEWNFAAEFHALEISESGVAQIRSKNIPGLRAVSVFDGYKLPYEENEFDLIILSHVLEHVEFERMLLREIRRVARNVVIEVPRDYKYGADAKIAHFLAYGHINIYTPTSFRYLLRSEGFEIINDKLSLIEPEVTRFNSFVNQGKPKSILNVLKIELEFLLKRLIIVLGGRKQHEKLANAYTVLLQKHDNSTVLQAPSL